MKLLIITPTSTILQGLKSQLEFLQESGLKIHTASPDDVPEQWENLPYQSIQLSTGLSPFSIIWSTWKHIRHIKKLKPAVIHSFGDSGFTAMLAARLCGVSHRLHTITDMPARKKVGFKTWLRTKITLSCATSIYAESVLLVDYVHSKFGSYREKLKMRGKGSSNGVDLQYLSATKEVQHKADTLNNLWRLQQRVVFIFTGRMTLENGVGDLVDAFLTLKKQFPAVKLLLMDSYGQMPEPLPVELDKKIEKEEDIIALGYQKDIRPYLLMGDVHVSPSRSNVCFPQEVLQASVMGLPSIATGINGQHDIIGHRANGLLIPQGDTSALVKAMAALAGSEEWRTTYGQKAREFTLRHFDQNYIWKEILREYRELTTQEETQLSMGEGQLTMENWNVGMME